MMLITWMLRVSTISTLVRGQKLEYREMYYAEPGKGSPVVDSLQCYNDYQTRVECQWEEDPRTTGNPSQLYLYYRDEYEETLCPFGAGVPLPSGKISRNCSYDTRRFSIGTKHTLYFDNDVEERTTISRVTRKDGNEGLVELKEGVAEGGGHRLSWKSLDSTPKTSAGFQLQYGVYTENWTTVDHIYSSEYVIEEKLLSPGFFYQAKVRERLVSGLSDWSPLVFWRTQTNSSANVFNTHCVLEREREVTCTWQTKTHDSLFVTFQLWCKNLANDDEVTPAPFRCCEHPVRLSSGPQMSEFTCSGVSAAPLDPRALQLRPAHFAKDFRVSRNIKLPQLHPVNILVSNGDIIVSWWCKKVYKNLPYSVQLQISSTVVKIFNVTCHNSTFVIPSGTLRPSTVYTAQVRYLFLPHIEYKGRSSEWSDPTVFTTDKGPWLVTSVSYIMASVSVVALFLIFYITLPLCHRKIILYEGSIPSPLNSTALEDMIKSSMSWPYLQSENENISICELQNAHSANIGRKCSGEFCSEDFSSKAVSKSWVDFNPSGDVTGLDFSGPYLFCCDECSSHYDSGDFSARHTRTCGKNDAPNPAYFTHPPAHSPGDPATDTPSRLLPHASGYFIMDPSKPKQYLAITQSET